MQQLCSEKPTKDPPLGIHSFVVDAVRVVRLITVTDAIPPIFLTWAKSIFNYLKALLSDSLHTVFDNYPFVEDRSKVVSKGRANKGKERKISNLN